MSGLELPFYDFCSFLEKKSSVENTTICFFKSIFAAVVMMLKLRKLVWTLLVAGFISSFLFRFIIIFSEEDSSRGEEKYIATVCKQKERIVVAQC